MADIAKIGFEADTTGLKRAKDDLDKIPPAAAKAETASGKLTRSIRELASTMSGRLVQGINAAGRALNSLTTGALTKLGGAFSFLKSQAFGLAAGMLAAFSFGAIVAALSETADRLDDVSKAASKLKVNTGDLQALGYAADLAGVSFDQLATVANKMNRVIGTAIAKGKENAGVFKLLGISAKTLADLPIDERFATIADKLNSMNLTADQTALILGQLGDRSGTLAALFEGGSEAISQASDQLDRFNGKITPEQGKSVEAMNDAFTTLGYAIQSAANQFVSFVSTTGITDVVNSIAELIGWFNRSAAAAKALGVVIWSVFNAVAFGIPNIVVGIGDTFKRVFGVTITQAVKASLNFVINGVTGMYGYIKNILNGVPQIFMAAFYGGAAMALKAINDFVQNAIKLFNSLAQAVGSAFGAELGNIVDPKGYDMSDNPMFQAIQKRADAAATNAQGVFTDANAALSAQMGVDNFRTSVDRTKDDIDPATKSVTDFGNALDTTGSKAGGAAEKLTELQGISKELDKIGAPFEQAKSAFDKLKELQENGIVTGDQYAAMLGRIEQAFMSAGGTAQQWSKIIAGQTSNMTTALKEFTTNSLTATGDAIADLAIEGKIDFKSLADSIIRDLIRVMWQALVVKPIISAVFPGLGFADGGVFAGGNLQAFADGGVVTRPTMFQFANGGTMSNGVMGEAGAEAIMPLTRGHDGKLGVEAHGGGSGGGGNSVSFGDVVINYEGTGDAEQDRRNIDQMSEAFTIRMREIANEQLQAAMNYGGAYNQRGGKR